MAQRVFDSHESTNSPHRDHRLYLLVLPAAIVVTAYATTYLLLPNRGFWINDNGCKFIQVQGIIRSNYQSFSIPWPGAELDPEFSFSPLQNPFGHVIDRHLYAQYSPVFALVSSFPYRLCGFDGLYVLPLFSAVVMLPGLWNLARGLSRSPFAPPLAVLIAALATPIWFYSMTFWEHLPAMGLTTWSMVLCLRHLMRGATRSLMAAALLCGFAIYFRDELYVFGGVMAVVSFCYGHHRWRTGLLFLLVLGISVTPLWWFQWQVLGHPLGYHFGAHSPLELSLADHVSQRWPVFRNLLVGSHSSLWLSILVVAPHIALFLTYPRLHKNVFVWMVPALAAVAGVGTLIILAGHLTSEQPIWWLRGSNSLFAASPVLILALVRGCSRRSRPASALPDEAQRKGGVALWLMALLYALAYAVLAPELNSVGIHWGCRFLLPVYPILAVLASVTVAQWWESCGTRARLRKALVATAAGLSVLMQIYSLYLLHERKQFSAELNRVVAARPEPVVVAKGWFIPQELSQCFYEKPVFYLGDSGDVNSLLTMLRRGGYERMLYVAYPPSPGPPGHDREIISDDLDFLAIEVRAVPLEP